MRAAHNSDWTWTVERHTVRDLDRLSDPALQDVLVGWRGLPDELMGRVPAVPPHTRQDAA